ncbi:hypothetical protein DWX08_09215 [Ruminococcus sp. AF18-22]|nr:hypothetical protein DWX08_09215 [Ruminococcus sp. AF18-22]
MKDSQKNIKNTIYFMGIVFIYKLTLEIGFWDILQKSYAGLGVYKFEFNFVKYIIGILWCTILAILIDYNRKKPSTFFVQMLYIVAIIPMTVIFAFSNENTMYFNCVCIAFAICEMIVLFFKNIYLPEIDIMTKILILGFFFITFVVYIDMIAENGMPSLAALNIYDVYQIRSNFHLNKYVGYLFEWQYTIITPFFIIRAYYRKKYITGFCFCFLQFLSYLYAAQKTILFIIPLVLALCIISRMKNFALYTYMTLVGGVFLITCGSGISEIVYRIYDLFVRRVLLLPANLKFIYYDFFSQNPKIGLAGTLWGKFLDIPHPYEERIGIIISKVYFNKPEMNSNTGFLAEGYYRFGIIGIFIVLILFAFILLCLDYFANSNGYAFAVTMGFFSIFLLNDGGLIDPLIFGHLTVLVLLCVFYNQKNDFKIQNKRIKVRRKHERTIIEQN